jgi:hypothetical protein
MCCWPFCIHDLPTPTTNLAQGPIADAWRGTGVPVFTGLAAFACGIAGHCEGNQSADPLAYGFAPEKVV